MKVSICDYAWDIMSEEVDMSPEEVARGIMSQHFDSGSIEILSPYEGEVVIENSGAFWLIEFKGLEYEYQKLYTRQAMENIVAVREREIQNGHKAVADGDSFRRKIGARAARSKYIFREVRPGFFSMEQSPNPDYDRGYWESQ